MGIADFANRRIDWRGTCGQPRQRVAAISSRNSFTPTYVANRLVGWNTLCVAVGGVANSGPSVKRDARPPSTNKGLHSSWCTTHVTVCERRLEAERVAF